MSELCKIYCMGSEKAPYDWVTHTLLGINRLIFINGGEGGYIKDNKKTRLKQGCLCLIPGNAYFIDTYTSYEKDEARLDHAYVNFELIPPIISSDVFCLDPSEDVTLMAAVEVFRTLCLKCGERKDPEILTDIEQKFLKSTVLFLVDKMLEKFHFEIVKDELIIKALRLMHEKVASKQTISDVAKACYLSTDGFIKKFKKEVGETPYAYLKKLRLRTAQTMRMEGVSLHEIAEKCGYSDASALLHAIKNA